MHHHWLPKDLMEKILPAVHHEAILVELPEEAVEA